MGQYLPVSPSNSRFFPLTLLFCPSHSLLSLLPFSCWKDFAGEAALCCSLLVRRGERLVFPAPPNADEAMVTRAVRDLGEISLGSSCRFACLSSFSSNARTSRRDKHTFPSQPSSACFSEWLWPTHWDLQGQPGPFCRKFSFSWYTNIAKAASRRHCELQRTGARDAWISQGMGSALPLAKN